MTKVATLTKNIKESSETQKKLFRVLITGTIVLSIFYIYLVGSITFNIIARKSLEVSLSSLNDKVNQLELTYLRNVNETNKDYAASLGFVDVSNNIFTARTNNHVAIR